MTPAPFLGGLLHAIGALSSAWCYTPQKRVRAWSWQTYWLAQAAVCWLILPSLVAWLTIPKLGTVLAEAPLPVMGKTTLLGMIFGIGGTAFGIAIRYVGFSITYALSIGISCVLGTLLPPYLSGELGAKFHQAGAGWVLGGIVIAATGILASGVAGWFKESDFSRNTPSGQGGSNAGKGLFFCVLAGVCSAVFNISLGAGEPLAVLAEKHGAGQFRGNVVYIFSCGGAFITTALYCIRLHLRHRTFGEYKTLPPVDAKASLVINFSMAILTGILWYGQFFFYNLGHVRMGEYGFTSWAIHMSMLVLFSTLAGLMLREWKGCRPRTLAALAFSIVILLVAIGMLTYGNHLGGLPTNH